MKKYLFLLLLPLLAFVPSTEKVDPKYEIVATPICWKYSGVDSNLVRYVLVSTSASSPIDLMYLNAHADTVDVSAGGTLQNGWCCDCTGTGGVEVSASNGLTEATGNDIELGGTLDRNTSINVNGKEFIMYGSGGEYLYWPSGNGYMEIGKFEDPDAHRYITFSKDISNYGHILINGHTVAMAAQSGSSYYMPYTLPSTTVGDTSLLAQAAVSSISDPGVYGNLKPVWMNINTLRRKLPSLPQYASDAAADADAGLGSGGLYQITGDRTVRRKP